MTNQSIFELTNTFNQLKSEMLIHHSLVGQLVKQMNDQLYQKWKSATYKQILTLASKDNDSFETLMDLTHNGETQLDVDLDMLKRYKQNGYSQFNCIVSLRTFWKASKAAQSELSESKDTTKAYLSRLKGLKSTLTKMNPKTTKRLLNEIEIWRGHMVDLLDYRLPIYDLVRFFEFLFIGGNNITKQEMLNLVVLDKTVETKAYIDSLPDDIDYKTFADAMFIHKIEDDNYSWICDIYIEDMIKNIKDNPEFKKESSGLFDEITKRIPTYSVQFDEFGEVDQIEKNMPKLRLIK
jgi:hypothetical protein